MFFSHYFNLYIKMNIISLRPIIIVICLILLVFALRASNSTDKTLDSLSIESYIKQQNIDAKSLNTGLFYTMPKEGKGQNPKKNDYVLVNFKGMLLDGTVFDASEVGSPFVFQVGHRQVIRGWEIGILVFKVGGKGTIYIPPQLAYGKTGAGVIRPNAPVKFEIELLKIMSESEYDEYMVELEKKERQKFLKQKKLQFERDKKDIHYYCSEKQIRAKALPSGLSYSITKKGKGNNAKSGDMLTVAYEGMLTDGTSFDASTKKKPYIFPLGQNKVIKGWEEGLKNFNEGSEGWLIIPSDMAYGPREIKEDNIHIPANSILVFKVKILKIESAKK